MTPSPKTESSLEVWVSVDPTKEQPEEPKPKEMTLTGWLYSFVILVSSTAQAVLLDWDSQQVKKQRPEAVGGSILKTFAYVFDSVLRLAVFAPLADWHALSQIEWTVWAKLSLSRLIGTMSLYFQFAAIMFVGSDIFAVGRQFRVPFVVIFRYLLMKIQPSEPQVFHLIVVTLGGIAFTLADAGGIESGKLAWGLSLLAASVTLRSMYYTVSEKFMKEDLKSASTPSQQFMFAVCDLFCFALLMPLEMWIEHQNSDIFVQSLTNWFFWTILGFFTLSDVVEMLIVDEVDATWTQLCFCGVMIAVWCTNLIRGKSFVAVKLPLLLIIVCAIYGYVRESKRSVSRRNSRTLQRTDEEGGHTSSTL